VAPFMSSDVPKWLDNCKRFNSPKQYPTYIYPPVATRLVDSVTNYVVLLPNGASKHACVPEVRKALDYMPIITISNSVDAARALGATLPPGESAVLDYQETQETRNRVREGFECGNTSILVATDLVTTGLNIKRPAAYVLVDFRKNRKQFFARRLSRAALNPQKTLVHILHAKEMGNFFSFCERWNIKFEYLIKPSDGAIEQATTAIEEHRKSTEDRSEQWYLRALAAGKNGGTGRPSARPGGHGGQDKRSDGPQGDRNELENVEGEADLDTKSDAEDGDLADFQPTDSDDV